MRENRDTGFLIRQIEQLQCRLDLLRSESAPIPDADRIPAALHELESAVKAMQTAEVELREQNEELVEMLHAIEAEKYRYQSLFEGAPDGYVVTDMGGLSSRPTAPPRAWSRFRRTF